MKSGNSLIKFASNFRSIDTLLILFLLVFSARGVAQTSEDVISRGKAFSYFIMNCAYFTTWHSSNNPYQTKKLDVYILGKDVLGNYIREAADQAEKKWFKDGKIIIKRGSSILDASKANIVYIANSFEEISDAIKALNYKPMLLISSATGFASSGGSIEVMIQENKLRFEMNLDILGNSGLQINSKLKSRAAVFIQGGQRIQNTFKGES